MSSYVGNRSNNPIVDLMLDTIQDRGYNPNDLDEAVAEWNDQADGEFEFVEDVLGPAINDLEKRLGPYGLVAHPYDEQPYDKEDADERLHG